MLTPLVISLLVQHADLPVVVVDRDNVRITESCIIRVPEGTIIPDTDGDGVIHVVADDVTVRFEPGAVLRGASVGDTPGLAAWDTLTGIGVRVDGVRRVRIEHAKVAGYKVGLYASNCDGFGLEGARFHDNFRQRLRSTPQREDSADWLWPHENDRHEWMSRYGGAVVVERASGVAIRDVRVRTGQNGIILDRVQRSRIVDCDASFLSGWGLALWRSSDNLVSRNALDFCVRGYSHDVYNRGQDSAGILCFEACQRNIFIENSATHGGDGFFGFGGKESLGETPPPSPDFDYAAAGCTENVFIGNDLSHAVAHGLEHTFSDRCIVIANRIVDNAICGIWGGYSNGWAVEDNTFEDNGAMGYGLERGAINIEHGGGHLIRNNTFVNNRVALHLWWDDDKGLLATPGVRARYKGPSHNEFSHNLVRIDGHHPFAWVGGKPPPLTVLQVRDPDGTHAKGNAYHANVVELASDGAQEFDLSAGISLLTDGAAERPSTSGAWKAEGLSSPLGARAALRGRQHIIMGEWGPWDHESPMMRYAGAGAGADRWQVFGATRAVVGASDDVHARVWNRDGMVEIECVPVAEGLCQYALSVDAGGASWQKQGAMLRTTWHCSAFPSPVDPRQDLAAWRAAGPGGTSFQLRGDLNLPLGGGGLRSLPGLGVARDSLPGGSNYGIIALTELPLPAGAWTVRTTSDDGVRVRVRIDGAEPRTVIEDWTHHAPAQDSGTFDLPSDARVQIEVEYFQLDGHAVLRLELLRGP
ncbi:MAG: right-handed parallel beta-helix repeat-containing protein [Phycisphaerales bacterium]|nr:right-handed parallel beta-helix repeat-containing protein [Phycisphaerales bacterium]